VYYNYNLNDDKNKGGKTINKMTIKIDKEKCIGCGSCAAICPEAFEMKDGKAHVKSFGSKAKCVKEAADSCPVDAIKVS